MNSLEMYVAKLFAKYYPGFLSIVTISRFSAIPSSINQLFKETFRSQQSNISQLFFSTLR